MLTEVRASSKTIHNYEYEYESVAFHIVNIVQQKTK